jgi:hypothetical protein
VLAPEHLLGLAGVDFPRQIVEPFREIVRDRLARLSPFNQDGKVLGTAAQRFAETLVVLQAASPLQQLLRGRLILPEVRLGDAFFYLREFVCRAGCVKDGSADRMRGGPNLRIGGAARLIEWS